MTKFLKPDVQELLGITPICTVTDEEIYTQLLTPMTRALLGPIQSGKVEVKDSSDGDFPGDEVTNYNDHRLYGGKSGFVRNRYVVSTYKTQFGALIVKRDGVKFKALGWFGDLEKKRVELIFKAALRDRRYDGTLQANDCALVEFEGFEDAGYNKPLEFDGVRPRSVEISIYGFMPGSRIGTVGADLHEYEEFVGNPFKFLDRPELFRKYFDRAWNSDRAPGQIAGVIPDISRLVLPAFERFAKQKGYDFIENAPSHYHVAMWSKAMGYNFTDPAMVKAMTELTAGINRLKSSGMKFTRAQESWLCVVQSLRTDLIPEGLNLGGAKWPQDNIGPQNLWMFKPLTDKGVAMLPAQTHK